MTAAALTNLAARLGMAGSPGPPRLVVVSWYLQTRLFAG
jgi:hypothetical protein